MKIARKLFLKKHTQPHQSRPTKNAKESLSNKTVASNPLWLPEWQSPLDGHWATRPQMQTRNTQTESSSQSFLNFPALWYREHYGKYTGPPREGFHIFRRIYGPQTRWGSSPLRCPRLTRKQESIFSFTRSYWNTVTRHHQSTSIMATIIGGTEGQVLWQRGMPKKESLWPLSHLAQHTVPLFISKYLRSQAGYHYLTAAAISAPCFHGY